MDIQKFKIQNKNSFKDYLGINQRLKINFLSKNIRLKKYKINFKTKKTQSTFIDFYKNINSYKGLRHKFNLPTRGQRTRTNAKTRKKKKSPQKQSFNVRKQSTKQNTSKKFAKKL